MIPIFIFADDSIHEIMERDIYSEILSWRFDGVSF